MPSMTPDPRFVVVCSDLHVAYGPFDDPDYVLILARTLTGITTCDFVPLPIFTTHEGMRLEGKRLDVMERKGAYEHKGYL